MTTSIANIVQVTIDAATVNPTKPTFGIPLVLGFHTLNTDRVRYYASLAAAIADGCTSGPIFDALSAIFAQEETVEEAAVGRLTVGPTQIMRFVPALKNTHVFKITLNGEVITAVATDGSATAAEAVALLITAINASGQAGVLTATAATTTISNDTLVVTSDTAGLMFKHAFTDPTDYVSVLNVTADVGLEAELAAIALESDRWYAIAHTSFGTAEIESIADFVASTKHIAINLTSDSDVISSATDDIASDEVAESHSRSAVLFSKNPYAMGHAAWLGKVLPDLPGESTWMFKNVSGITAETLTDTEKGRIDTKKANIYDSIAGVSMFRNGVMSNGQFIDTTIFLDFLEVEIQNNVFTAKVNNKKIAYTDAGIAVLGAAVRKALNTGADQGGLVRESIVVTLPKAADATTSDKGNRILRQIEFTATLQGAIHKTIVHGTVSV